MLNKIKLGLVALLLPLVAFAQSYPSPTFQNLTVNGTLTVSGGGAIGLGALAAQAANTVVANVTAASASPTAVALPSCSTANSALKYTGATGFSCGTAYALTSGTLAQFASTTSAQLASVISDGTGTGSAVFAGSPALTGTPTAPTASLATNTTQLATTAFVLANAVTSSSPTITTPNIVGVSNGSNAAAGSVGEYVTSSNTGVSLTSGIAANVTSISLTAGDWDVTGQAVAVPAASTVLTNWEAGINTVSATMPSVTTGLGIMQLTGTLGTGSSINPVVSPMVTRISLSSTTTVFLVANASFTTSTLTTSGFIRARRVR